MRILLQQPSSLPYRDQNLRTDMRQNVSLVAFTFAGLVGLEISVVVNQELHTGPLITKSIGLHLVVAGCQILFDKYIVHTVYRCATGFFFVRSFFSPHIFQAACSLLTEIWLCFYR